MDMRYFVSQNLLNFINFETKFLNILNSIILYLLFRLKYQPIAALRERSLLSRIC